MSSAKAKSDAAGAKPTSNRTPVIIHATDLQKLVELLRDKGYTVAGPTIRDRAIVLDEIASVDDLPVGWIDQQDNGRYRLAKSRQKTYFGYTVGMQSWKKYLYTPMRELWTAERKGHRFALKSSDNGDTRYALLGVRACELQALAIHDQVLTEGPYADATYARLRESAFVIAVNCTRAGGTCFCASMGTGPKADTGYDLALTEVLEGKQHYFVVDAGTEAGAAVVKGLPHEAATAEQVAAADQAVAKAASSMGRKLALDGLKDELYAHFDHPHWNKVAERCLSCGNCTMVCPTCFCVNVEDSTSLTGDQATRTRRWDSCFTVDFSYIHGGSIRASDYSRYRQWLMHKLVYWQDQFGRPGCVGCGRCITWCPVGIDITEEARLIRE